MVHPRPGGDASPTAAKEARLIRLIREHIAKGNKPDWERAERLTRRMDERIAKTGPSGMLDGLSDEQVDQLAVAIVRDVRREVDLPRASNAWPLECE